MFKKMYTFKRWLSLHDCFGAYFMKIKEDARITKTKERLYRAYLDMLAQKSYEDITINEICVNAGVRRATFYKHFQDKYDFSTAMTATFISLFDANMKNSKYKSFPIEYHIEYEHRLVRYLAQNEDIVNRLLKSNLFPALYTLIVQENYKVLKERLTQSVQNGERLVASVDTIATVLAGGIGTIIGRWFEEGRPTSEEELISELDKLVYAMFIK